MLARASAAKELLLCASIVLSTATAQAADPKVTFDFGRTAECHDVTEEEAAEVYEGEKVVELQLRISVHLLSGEVKQLEEVRVDVSDYDSRIRVLRFSPNTTLESHHSQSIRRTTTKEKSHSIDATLGGKLPVPMGDAVASVTPSISGGMGKIDTVSETEYRLPPQHTVVASGTIAKEHGVFFKLRSSPLSSLEGTHEFTVRFIVPQNWRGDSVRVCCQATGQDKLLWMKQEATWARSCAPVAIYLAGDLKARQAAEKFAARGKRL